MKESLPFYKRIPGWIWSGLALALVLGVPRLWRLDNHRKFIDAANESCRIWEEGKLATQREAIMAGLVSQHVDLKGKTNNTKESVQEYARILRECGFTMD